MEPTSEQELKELLDEGRISEEEYRQLLEALHQKQKLQPSAEEPIQYKPPNTYGKAALILMIAGIVLPFAGIAATIFFDTAVRWSTFLFLPLLLLGLLCGIFAFIFGIIGFKSPSGKIAALGTPCLGLLAVVVLPVLFLFAAKATSMPEYANERLLEYYKAYPLDSLEGVLTQDAELDTHISADGNGSLRIQTDSPGKTVYRLFETGPIGKEDRMLIYSAKLRTEKLNGKAYLEMWCDFSGKGEFFSRGLQNPVTGTTDWTNVQTPFRLETGQMPANVKLNLVIEGAGTVWIDDIKLLLSPLH
jgi:hypothetical protein